MASLGVLCDSSLLAGHLSGLEGPGGRECPGESAPQAVPEIEIRGQTRLASFPVELCAPWSVRRSVPDTSCSQLCRAQCAIASPGDTPDGAFAAESRTRAFLFNVDEACCLTHSSTFTVGTSWLCPAREGVRILGAILLLLNGPICANYLL
jgi:hypothetical protein